MIKKIFSENILMVDVIGITGSREEAQKFLDRHKCTLELQGVGCCAIIPNSGGFIVWVQDPRDFYVLMHECVHLTNFIFNSKGMNTNLSNEDETFAYFMAYWFRTLWRFFGNIKKGKKNG